MKLYYAPFACSLAAHIACREAGFDVELIRVDLPTKKTAAGGDLRTENAMGQVPTLVLDDGRTLTESVAVLSYLADRAAEGQPRGSDRYEVLRWTSFVATELHKSILAPIHTQSSPDAVKEHARASAGRVLDVVSARLEARDFVVGDAFTVADAFLFWALSLLPHAGISLDRFPDLRRYYVLHRERPAVRAALVFEKERYETPFAPA